MIKEKTTRIVELGLLAVVTTAGIGSCFNCLTKQEPLRDPNTLAWNSADRTVEVDDYGATNGLPIVSYVWDANKDGVADAIGRIGSASWYTDDWKGEKLKKARQMTPEIREAATEALRSKMKLERLLYEERYKEQQATTQGAQ
jgi:hypothetical protein